MDGISKKWCFWGYKCHLDINRARTSFTIVSHGQGRYNIWSQCCAGVHRTPKGLFCYLRFVGQHSYVGNTRREGVRSVSRYRISNITSLPLCACTNINNNNVLEDQTQWWRSTWCTCLWSISIFYLAFQLKCLFMYIWIRLSHFETLSLGRGQGGVRYTLAGGG